MYYFYFFFFLFAALMVAFIFKDNLTLWPVNESGNSITWANNNAYWQAYPGANSYYVEGLGEAQVKEPGGEFVKSVTLLGDATSVETFDGSGNIRITAKTFWRNVTIQIAPCFLAGSLVFMKDGSEKKIEDVKIGDLVRGAFGEINKVLALHRPLLGNHKMLKINDDHVTSNHHPHIGADMKFYSGDPQLVSGATYNISHVVITENGEEERFLHGLKPERIHKLEIGTLLQTKFGGQYVETLEVFDMPPDTQLYNLVIDNSHTYVVEGYAVTGWPKEDFDYDNWRPLN